MSDKTILISGGAGYIGSHAVLVLQEAGYEVVVIDNLSTGSEKIAAQLDVKLYRGDIADESLVSTICATHKPIAAMHFAAFAYVGESVTDPAKYYLNNFTRAVAFVDALRKSGVSKFIFSSTCATYGVPAVVPITEETPQSPINPYGFSKFAFERVLKDYESAYGLKSVIFRYFNAAGAHPSGRIGEVHDPETHLIPLAISAAMGGEPLKVFGTDYPTPDGTCIRDYIHINDIATAHQLGLEYLMRKGGSDIFNIGNGNGYSVLEVIKAVEKISGKKVPFKQHERRAGDPPVLVAAADKIRNTLRWQPKFPSLEAIVETAWRWHSR